MQPGPRVQLAHAMIQATAAFKIIPMHHAVTSASLRALDVLLRIWPEGAVAITHDYTKHTVFCTAVCRRLDLVCMIAQLYPPALRQRCPNGDLPIHVAARYAKYQSEKHRDIFYHLLSLWPESLTMRGRKGNTILHDVTSNAAVALMKDLCHRWPAGLLEYNDFGLTPFHESVLFDYRLVIPVMHQALPGAIQVRVKWTGATVMQLAVRTRSPRMLWELVAAWPEGVMIANVCSHTPLHCAAVLGRNAVMYPLLKVCPEVLKVQDRDGDTVLHVAARLGKFDALRLFLRRWPEGVLVSNHRGKTPIDVARSFKILKELMSCAPPVPAAFVVTDRLAALKVVLSPCCESMTTYEAAVEKLRSVRPGNFIDRFRVPNLLLRRLHVRREPKREAAAARGGVTVASSSRPFDPTSLVASDVAFGSLQASDVAFGGAVEAVEELAAVALMLDHYKVRPASPAHCDALLHRRVPTLMSATI